MSCTKLLQTFLILLLVANFSFITTYDLSCIKDEDPIPTADSESVEILEEPMVKESKIPMIVLEPATSEVLILEPRPLTQQEEIELHIQQVVSLYPNLSEDLISAIIWRESRYDPNARNYDGSCVGLMQVSTKWHTDRARNLGVEDLYDPYGNILTGCDLLSELLNSYNLETALMVYHGGYSYAQKYQSAGTIDQYTKDILSYAQQLKEVT